MNEHCTGVSTSYAGTVRVAASAAWVVLVLCVGLHDTSLRGLQRVCVEPVRPTSAHAAADHGMVMFHQGPYNECERHGDPSAPENPVPRHKVYRSVSLCSICSKVRRRFFVRNPLNVVVCETGRVGTVVALVRGRRTTS